MADNYLEKRYEEVFGARNAGTSSSALHPTLDALLARNRSCRAYDRSYAVHRFQLEAIVRVNTRVASACNAQRLRFRLVLKGGLSSGLLSCLNMGTDPDGSRLPLPGMEPESFIVVCSKGEADRELYTDLGISCQSMLLKASEMGLGGVIVFSFDKTAVRNLLSLDLEPLAVLPIGRPAERPVLVGVGEDGSLVRYRDENGVPCVPKLPLESILV